MFSSTYYSKSPLFLQESLISLRAWSRALLREGKPFQNIVMDVAKTQWLEKDGLTEYRDNKLLKLLCYASEHVPFYREYADRIVVAGKRIDSIKTLDKYPLLDKTIVRNAGQQLLSDTTINLLFKSSTSGTTGTPLTLYQDLRAINYENAHIWRQLLWAGFTQGAKRAWIRGDMIVPVRVSEAPFWRMNRTENILMLSSYHLSERHAPAYLDALARFDPVVIQAYPSSITFLATYLESAGKHYAGNALKGVVTSSETLNESQRRVIEARFGCRVFDWYGQSERVAAIGTCEHGCYHVMSDYSYVEFLPAEGGLFEIVGTGYNNLAMPLIRYRTGDFVELHEGAHCPCGRVFPVIRSIHGRSDDSVKLADGRRIGRMDHIFKDAEGILEAQIVQDALDELVIRVVPGPGYGEIVEQKLLKNARNRLGDEIRIRIDQVESLERTRNGKLRNVICNV